MRQKIFHTIIYLKIPYHLHQPTFGRDEFFFPFSSKIPYAYFLNGLTHTQKKLHQMCYCDVQANNANKIHDLLTIQTKFARFRQKRSGYYVGPQRLREIDAPASKQINLA